MYLDKANPASIRKFQEVYDKTRVAYPDPGPPPAAPPGPGGLGAISEYFNGGRSRRKWEHECAMKRWRSEKREHERWNRPFDDVVYHFTEEGTKFIVQDVGDDCQDALARFLGTGDVYDFRANELREELNAVAHYAYREQGEDWPIIIANDHTPAEMLERADEIEQSLQAYKAFRQKEPHVIQPFDEEQIKFHIEIVEAAISWLRFWGGKGHGLVMDW